MSPPNAASEGAAWIEEHKVCWCVGPLSEPLSERGVVETGYELVLSGRFHPGGPADLEARARKLRERLRVLALEVIGRAPSEVVLSILPRRRGTVAGEDRLAIEIELVVVGSLVHPDKLPAPVAARQRIAELEARLRGMGLPSRGESAT